MSLQPDLRPGSTWWRPPADGAFFVWCYAVLLLAVPSRLVFAPLGGAGTPAQVLGIGGLLWWTWHWLAQPTDHDMRAQPLRRSMLAFAGAIMVSYVAAALRPINDAELSTAEMGVLSLMSWLGVFLVAQNGIPDRARLETLISRLVMAAGLVALLGIAQFATGRALTDVIQVPGLSVNSVLVSVREREGFNRPSGTALHPIEFGAAMTVLLPLCFYTALHQRHLGAIRRWFPVVAIAFAVPLSISRSAMLSGVVVLMILLPSWTRSMRRTALLGMLAGMTAFFLFVPGFLGTMTGLFTGVGTDSSALSRSSSFALAWEFIRRAPIVGRGFMTFLPEYRILDNQYLLLLIDAGVVGLVGLLALFATAMVVGSRLRRRAEDEATSYLALSLVASAASAAASFAFFDALSFPMLSGLTFLVLGLLGCLHRITPKPALAEHRPTAR